MSVTAIFRQQPRLRVRDVSVENRHRVRFHITDLENLIMLGESSERRKSFRRIRREGLLGLLTMLNRHRYASWTAGLMGGMSHRRAMVAV